MDNKEAEGAPTAPNILRLPAELQLHIIQHLTFGELEHLRRTCRFYRAFISPAVVGRLFGTAHRLQAALLSTCRDCLRTEDPVASSPPTMLWAGVASADWPLASRCVVCAFKARDLYVDEQITFADWTSAYVCRWCGMPVHVGQTSDYTSMQVNEFHVPCWDAYKRVHHRFLLLGLLSAGVAVLASASSMVLVPRNPKILIPAVINLVLGLLVYVIMWFRTDKSRTFHFVAVIDVVIVAIWLSSLVEFGAMMRNDRTGTVSTLDAVFLGMLPIGIAMIVRLIDIAGNIVLATDYRHWQRQTPSTGWVERTWRPVETFLVHFTWPKITEAEYPYRMLWYGFGRLGGTVVRMRQSEKDIEMGGIPARPGSA